MKPVNRWRSSGASRLETFVDAAFAFAVTMLIISVENIPTTFDDLLYALREVPAFAASFALVAMFWHAHYRWSRRYGLEDGWSTILSLSLVFAVLVYLYPLRIVAASAFNAWTGGWLPAATEMRTMADYRWLFGVYGFAFATMSLIVLLLFVRALSTETEPPLDAVEREFTRLEVKIWSTLAGSGLLSALFAVTLQGGWIALSPYVYVLLPIVIPLMVTRAHKRAARL